MASKKELKKKQKINVLKAAADGLTKLGGGMAKEASKAASGVAKGISNVAKASGGAASEAAAGPVTGIMKDMKSSNTKSTHKDVRTQKISSLKKAADAATNFGGNMIKEAAQEKNVGKKFGGISPIMSKGTFTAATPKQTDTQPALTQSQLDKKKKKR